MNKFQYWIELNRVKLFYKTYISETEKLCVWILGMLKCKSPNDRVYVNVWQSISLLSIKNKTIIDMFPKLRVVIFNFFRTTLSMLSTKELCYLFCFLCGLFIYCPTLSPIATCDINNWKKWIYIGEIDIFIAKFDNM